MTEVAVCPRCAGDKRIYNARSGQTEPCPTCSGEGVVWRGDRPQEGAAPTENGELDLTYRP